MSAIGRVAGKVGDLAFKAFTAGLGVATIYLTATFSANVYTGISWHKAQQFTSSRLIEGNILFLISSFMK
ncbi:hypothetical protein MKW94_029781 [Papaver nudicaule]|uniref:Uncharacterized protein n=1 Tax=Papaver nudicaule TaxID=74823 RepID=A0AA41S1M2_PAPNU|nr:hypothetical protein [Papaver nudicaule]